MTVTRAAGRRSGWISLSYHQARIDVLQFFRDPMAAVFSFSLPVILLALFGAVFHFDIGGTGVSFRQYFIAGVIAAGLVSTSFASLAFGLAYERDVGSLKRMAGTPMTPMVFFLGKMGMTLFSSACQIGLMFGIAIAFFDLRVPLEPGRLAVLAYVFWMGSASCAFLGIAYSRMIRNPNSAAAMVMMPFVVLQIISGVFIVVSDLTVPLQVVAGFFPLRWMASLLRYVFLPESFGAFEPGGSWNVALGLAMLAGWTAVGAALCLRTFRWHFDD